MTAPLNPPVTDAQVADADDLFGTFDKPETIPGAAPGAMRFNGPEYDAERDEERLTGQILRVFNLMRDGNFRTLSRIAALTGDPQASISAQLRHLRKERFGGHTVIRRHIERGLFEYQLIVAAVPPSAANDAQLQLGGVGS